jgi:hypothetical protein
VKHPALTLIPLLLAPQPGIVANAGDYPPIDPDPGPTNSTDATSGNEIPTRDADATPPPFEIRTPDRVAATKRSQMSNSYSSGAYDHVFRKEIGRRRKANKVAAKARKKNRK